MRLNQHVQCPHVLQPLCPSKTTSAARQAATYNTTRPKFELNINMANMTSKTPEKLKKTPNKPDKASLATFSASQDSSRRPQEAESSEQNKFPQQSAKSRPASKTASKTAWILKNTGATIRTITADSIVASPSPVTSTAPFTLLCSYNWQLSGHAIQVPGGPPKWTPPPLPVTLSPDSGRQFVDQNASRVPKYPFEPAFRAILAMNSTVRLDDVDIVVNRNSLRKLLDFAGGKRQDPFRMGLCMVRNTLFITRNERNASMMIHSRTGTGYGHGFEKGFTTPEDELRGSSSHHRVIRYMLGDLNCVVRFEVDAWLESDEAEPTDKLDDIAKSIAQLSIRIRCPSSLPPAPKHTPHQHRHSTTVLPAGTQVPPSRLAELKTISSPNRSNSSSTGTKAASRTPQLWFGRTPFLINGFHANGTFHTTVITDVSARFSDWETEHQDKLRKMVGILSELKRVLVERGEGCEAVLVCETKGGALRILETRGNQGALPGDLLGKFWSGGE